MVRVIQNMTNVLSQFIIFKFSSLSSEKNSKFTTEHNGQTYNNLPLNYNLRVDLLRKSKFCGKIVEIRNFFIEFLSYDYTDDLRCFSGVTYLCFYSAVGFKSLKNIFLLVVTEKVLSYFWRSQFSH